ncbi:MAG: hypothetical protein Q8L40_03390 [Burkholderiales bacterium]|nr:hypothetical protein [Burkholderiales bacterium]
MSDFAFYIPGKDDPIAGESGSSYVLAGQARKWLLKADFPVKTNDGRLRLKAYTDAGNVDVELSAGKP